MIIPFLVSLTLTNALTVGIKTNPNSVSEMIRFQTGDMMVIMKLQPASVVENATLRDGTRTINNFSGVVRRIDYQITSLTNALPKNMRVKEVLELAWQSHFPEFEVLAERERSVSVGIDGTFSDLLALGTNNGTSFPPDFKQIVRQRLYLIHEHTYPSGRLLAILAIERRTKDIIVHLLSPKPSPSAPTFSNDDILPCSSRSTAVSDRRNLKRLPSACRNVVLLARTNSEFVGQTVPNKEEALIREAVVSARRALNRDACARFFGQAAQSVLGGATFRMAPIGPPLAVAGSSGKFQTTNLVIAATYRNFQAVLINRDGPFVEPSKTIHGRLYNKGLPDQDFRMIVVLHELGHLLGKFNAEGTHMATNEEHTNAVIKHCYSPRKKHTRLALNDLTKTSCWSDSSSGSIE